MNAFLLCFVQKFTDVAPITRTLTNPSCWYGTPEWGARDESAIQVAAEPVAARLCWSRAEDAVRCGGGERGEKVHPNGAKERVFPAEDDEHVVSEMRRSGSSRVRLPRFSLSTTLHTTRHHWCRGDRRSSSSSPRRCSSLMKSAPKSTMWVHLANLKHSMFHFYWRVWGLFCN